MIMQTINRFYSETLSEVLAPIAPITEGMTHVVSELSQTAFAFSALKTGFTDMKGLLVAMSGSVKTMAVSLAGVVKQQALMIKNQVQLLAGELKTQAAQKINIGLTAAQAALSKVLAIVNNIA